ncbi:hypothetical protein [Pelagibaculum spongiae]|uniref:Uncharacterized protein n=1 Tax=Pelagibaculum spongiae TaxID=2080658 RepID=A0A2V1H035_9GAMM|nr:hypothetical protein [Pelagibaculum spongiae]PVZ72356.1 hypothetical protein DC094_04935 [Pelagibaculum spongiae]
MLLIFFDLDETILSCPDTQTHLSKVQKEQGLEAAQGGDKANEYLWVLSTRRTAFKVLYWLMYQKVLRFAAENTNNCKVVFITMGGHQSNDVQRYMQEIVDYRRSGSVVVPTTIRGDLGYDVINKGNLEVFEQDPLVKDKTHPICFFSWLKENKVIVSEQRGGILKKMAIEKYLKDHVESSIKVDVIVVDDNKHVREFAEKIDRTFVGKLEVFDPQAKDYGTTLAYIGARVYYHGRVSLHREHVKSIKTSKPKLIQPG